MNIEVEVRSFLSQEQYQYLLQFFKQNATFLKEDEQETIYFKGKEDLRIQKNKFFSKVWLKKGKLHDNFREEIEVHCKREDFEVLEKLFLTLGYEPEIKWFRKRQEFDWNNCTVCLDDTKGYGYILEIEKMCSTEEKEQEFNKLKERIKSLNIELTPKEELDRKFKEYKESWKSLIGY